MLALSSARRPPAGSLLLLTRPSFVSQRNSLRSFPYEAYDVHKSCDVDENNVLAAAVASKGRRRRRGDR